MRKYLVSVAFLSVVLASGACTTPEYVEVEVVREVPVEVIKEVEVVREVPVEVIKEVEVVREVPVEVIREVEKPIEPYDPMYLDHVRWTSETEDQIRFRSSRGYIEDVAWVRPIKFDYRVEDNDLYLEVAVDVTNQYDTIVGVDVASENFYLVTRDNEVIEEVGATWTGDNICDDLEVIRNSGQCWLYFKIPQHLEEDREGIQFVQLYNGNANPKSFNWEIAN